MDLERITVTAQGRSYNYPRGIRTPRPIDGQARQSLPAGRECTHTHVWGNDVFVGDRTIDVHIRKLREKIGDDRIGTVKGMGYKFEA
jgi:two-component system alkaline phosphatase synthesis response regulator PhoP